MGKKLEENLGWEHLKENECSPTKDVVEAYCFNGKCDEYLKEASTRNRFHYTN